jgi:hypothetical protein
MREKWADFLQLLRTNRKGKQIQTKQMFAKEMQPLQDVRARANQVLFCSLGTSNFVVWWDFSFLFVLFMHLIRQLAETMSV